MTGPPRNDRALDGESRAAAENFGKSREPNPNPKKQNRQGGAKAAAKARRWRVDPGCSL